MSAAGRLRELGARLRGTLMPSPARLRADDALREELESHLEMHVADNIRRGMSPAAARRDALRAAGGMSVAAEAVRDQRGVPAIESIARDVRDAMRGLAGRPGYVAAVVATLALGIGANTAMFSVVNAVVLHPLPYPNADRVMAISQAKNGEDQGVVADRAYEAWEASATTIDLAAYSPVRGTVLTNATPARITGREVRPAYFHVLGVEPLVGRALTAGDCKAGAPAVIVLSEQWWRRDFGADSSVVGRTITLDERPTTIVGVMRAAASTASGAQYWVPFVFQPHEAGSTYYWSVIGRLRDGVSLARARAELAALTPRISGWEPFGSGRVTPVVMSLATSQFGDRRKPLLLLFGAVAVLLAIACANVANLALVRAAGRQREFAIRLTLGASRWRIGRELLMESLALASTGGVLGLLLAMGLVRYFVHLSPSSVGNPDRIHVDGSVLLFTTVIALASALAFGVAPVLVAGHGDLSRALSNGTPRASIGQGQLRFRRALVVGQLATALMLLTCAGLVAHSFWRVTSSDSLGFRPSGLLSIAPALPAARYSDDRSAEFYLDLLGRVIRLPSVQHAALAYVPPLSGMAGSFSTRDSAGRSTPPIDMTDVGPEYFRTIDARLIAGREFTSRDGAHSPRVVIVDDVLARRLFPDGGALGKTIAGPGGKSTIVGIVSNVRVALEREPRGLLYASLAQQGAGASAVVMIRARGSASVAETAVSELVRAMDRTLPPPKVQRLDDTVSEAAAPRAFVFVLLSMFAGTAALLAIVGLYGVLSRLVSERTREIGIRVALGADPRRVVRLVLGQGVALAAIGTALGFAGSVASARVIRSLLFETSAYDSWGFAAATLLLVVVSLAASLLPARRATRIDPVAALRQE